MIELNGTLQNVQDKVNDGTAKFDHIITISGVGNGNIALDNTKLWSNGLTIEDAVSSDSQLDIGAIIVGKCEVSINNIDGTYDGIDFVGGTVGVKLREKSIANSDLNKGVFSVVEARGGDIVKLTCYDNAIKLDKKFSDVEIEFPITLRELVRRTCGACGVTCGNLDEIDYAYTVNERPSDEYLTCREVVQYALQMCGKFARMNNVGVMMIGQFGNATTSEATVNAQGYVDFGSNVVTTLTTDNLLSTTPTARVVNGYLIVGEGIENVHSIIGVYSSDVGNDDSVITKVTLDQTVTTYDYEDGEEIELADVMHYELGQNGYTIAFAENPLINNGDGQNVLSHIYDKVVGLRWRKANLTHTANPFIEAGDNATFYDRKGRSYNLLVTRTTYTSNSSQKTVSASMNVAVGSAPSVSDIVKNNVQIAEIKNEVNKKVTNVEIKFNEKMQEAVSNINANVGYYNTTIELEDGSSIRYTHDQPNLADSKIVWKYTADGWLGTNEYTGDDVTTTWKQASEANGDIVAEQLTAKKVVGVEIEGAKFTGEDAVFTSNLVFKSPNWETINDVGISVDEERGWFGTHNAGIGVYSDDDVLLEGDEVILYVNDSRTDEWDKKGEESRMCYIDLNTSVPSFDSWWVELPLLNSCTKGTLGQHKGARVRQIGNLLYVNGCIVTPSTWDGNSKLVIAQIPRSGGYNHPESLNDGFDLPISNTYQMCACASSNIARCYVNDVGEICAEWRRKLSDGTAVSGSGWIEFSFTIGVHQFFQTAG